MTVNRLVALLAVGGCIALGRYIYDSREPPDVQRQFEPYGSNPYAGAKATLDGMTLAVHKVYPYSGPASSAPYSYARMIAVDMEFTNPGPDLDLDDLDIIDGATMESYGSDPDMIGLSLDGAKILPIEGWPEDRKHYRGLFIYIIRKKTPTIKVGYWGHVLTASSIPVSEGAPLPVKPEKKDVYLTGSM